MIFLLSLFQLFASPVQAEIVAEDFVVMGYHDRNLISIREHKLSTGKGFSAFKSVDGGQASGHTLSEAHYIDLKRDLVKAIKPMKQTEIRSIASCDDEILVGSKAPKGPSGLNRICPSRDSAESRKALVNWIKKVSRDL